MISTSRRPASRAAGPGRGGGRRGERQGREPRLMRVLSAGDREKGEMGLGAVPGRQAAFREGLEQAVLYAKALGCPRYPTLSSCTSSPSWPVSSKTLPHVWGLGEEDARLERLGSLNALALPLLQSWSFVSCLWILCVVCSSPICYSFILGSCAGGCLTKGGSQVNIWRDSVEEG